MVASIGNYIVCPVPLAFHACFTLDAGNVIRALSQGNEIILDNDEMLFAMLSGATCLLRKKLVIFSIIKIKISTATDKT